MFSRPSHIQISSFSFKHTTLLLKPKTNSTLSPYREIPNEIASYKTEPWRQRKPTTINKAKPNLMKVLIDSNIGWPSGSGIGVSSDVRQNREGCGVDQGRLMLWWFDGRRGSTECGGGGAFCRCHD
ncbi:unnamed protein product [Vicia faba]|uniref:Uncharacterized protein n=1 Tax=Vicia faba TaxID=3906 RepID=A0AAV1A6A8_VICFA|nr:unnamed protein product [Vicia faba]